MTNYTTPSIVTVTIVGKRDRICRLRFICPPAVLSIDVSLPVVFHRPPSGVKIVYLSLSPFLLLLSLQLCTCCPSHTQTHFIPSHACISFLILLSLMQLLIEHLCTRQWRTYLRQELSGEGLHSHPSRKSVRPYPRACDSLCTFSSPPPRPRPPSLSMCAYMFVLFCV
jgi:hypothetical protein